MPEVWRGDGFLEAVLRELQGEERMTPADTLRALIAAATEGPWELYDGMLEGPARGFTCDCQFPPEDAALIVWLVNNAERFATLLDAAEEWNKADITYKDLRLLSEFPNGNQVSKSLVERAERKVRAALEGFREQ